MQPRQKNDSFTFIVVPERHAEVKRFHVKKSWVVQVFIVLLLLIAVGLIGTIKLFQLSLERHTAENTSATEVTEELESAQLQLRASLSKTDEVVAAMIKNSRRRESELADLRTRYETLKVLTDGKEDIARAHRAILMERSVADRVIDLVTGLVLGILTSLAAAWIWSKVESQGRKNQQAEEQQSKELVSKELVPSKEPQSSKE